MLWKESWQNMTFGIFAHGLQISFANTHWWQNLCAFVDILHAQHKHWSFLFSEWEIHLILGIELKFYQNICADFLSLASRGEWGSLYLGLVCVNFFLCYYCWMPRTSLTRLCCPEIGLEVFDPVCKSPSLWILFITEKSSFQQFSAIHIRIGNYCVNFWTESLNFESFSSACSRIWSHVERTHWRRLYLLSSEKNVSFQSSVGFQICLTIVLLWNCQYYETQTQTLNYTSLHGYRHGSCQMFYTCKIHNYLDFTTPACTLQVFSLHLWWTSIQVEGKVLVGRE